MGEPKPLASLSSSLLARKGHAKPAMRPQGFASFGFSGLQQPMHEDLGWNDMGHDQGSADIEPISADVYQLVPNGPVEVPAVVRQQEELARELAPEPAYEPVFTPVAVRPVTPRAAAGSKGKAAFTLRLDPERHLQLRLACAMAHKSAQALVIAALDAFLSQQPGVAEMVRAAATDKTAK
jgi:hypothetical protein